MIIDLVKLGESQIDFRIGIEPSGIDLESDFIGLKENVSFHGRLENQISRVVIKGSISAVVELVCSRCLTAVPEKIDLEFENAYVTPENYTEDEEIELDIRDLDVSIFEGEMLDLREIAREQILLALPSQVLCREDCQGLCEKCGANRNLKNCDCLNGEIDPRLSVLKSMLKKEEGSS